MGTKAAVVCANLGVGYLEVKLFDRLPSLYPIDFVQYFINNYFRFLDDVDYSWLEEFDAKPFQTLCNTLDPHINFIFSELSKKCNFLDINMEVVDYELKLDIYKKPTDSFNYLHFSSCHPLHTRKNIALSLAKRIIRISSHNRDIRLDELRDNLLSRGHPLKNILGAFSKVFSPACRKDEGDAIVFTTTHNPTQAYPKKFFNSMFNDLNGDTMKRVFNNCRVIKGTRQPKALRQYLIRSKFSWKQPSPPSPPGLFTCHGCKYHRLGYIKPCRFFRFGKDEKYLWEYRRHFTCVSKNVIYVLQCKRCWKFYIGETKNFKSRVAKHKSDIKNPRKSNCRTLAEHLRTCSSFPHFRIFPIMYVDDRSRRKFQESRLIRQYKPPLNRDWT